MCADISVGDTARNPHDTLVTRALAYELHDPRLLGVGYREALARRCVSVGVSQIDNDVDSLTRRAGTLQGDIYQRTVVDTAFGIHKLLTPAECRLGDDERMLVHVADGRIGFARLRDVRQVTARVPFVDGHHGAGLVASAGCVVQRAVQRVRVGGIGDHGRAVGRCPFGYDEIGTGCGCAIGEEGCRREAILEFSHRFSGFDPKCTKQILNGKTPRG